MKLIIKKYFLIILLLLLGYSVKAQDIFTDSKMKVSFFSETPIENISAKSAQGSGALNIKTKQVFATVKIKSFQFPKELMQEHFNDDYMESDKYRDGNFNGIITDEVNFTKNGTYTITAKGKLTLHGVSIDRTIPLTITVTGNEIAIHSEFMVHIADHRITVPKLVIQHIAEDVKVTVDGKLSPYAGN